MRILVTGALGFIGQNLTSRLLNIESEVWLLDLVRPKRNLLNINHISVNLANIEELEKARSKIGQHFDACIHLAGQTNVRNSLDFPIDDLKGNVLSTINLLSVFKFKRLIFVSTGSVYEGCVGKVRSDQVISPTIPYAISKFASELYIKSFHKYRNNPEHFLILRLFNPYGPHSNLNSIISKLIIRFGIEKIPSFAIQGTGKALIDPMYVLDTVEAIIRALYSNAHKKTIDICFGSPFSIFELAQFAAAAFDIEPQITLSGVTTEEIEFYGDPTPQKKLIGFKPKYSLKQGINHYYQFLKNQA
ncbi:MAG: NAD-dependent epimerase/dehydratase family protein [Candidatus Heimdallarchaeota archaeon]